MQILVHEAVVTGDPGIQLKGFLTKLHASAQVRDVASPIGLVVSDPKVGAFTSGILAILINTIAIC